MSDTAPKPAFQSLTLKSAAAIAVAIVASKLKIQLPEGAAQDLASAAIDLMSTLGLIGVAIGRSRAKGPVA
ncbi:hypothetical protein [Terricaulis sp.]|uniref:hypothetical protein n=1 Tax=Terricaulis sp. TaxID=2768686 RepID=UPI00378380BF